jgi:hypothetical protein
MESPEARMNDRRYDDLLLSNIKQLGDRLDTHAEEERTELSAMRSDIGKIHEEIAVLRVRLSVIWGVASCLGGAVVIGAAKLVGALRG